MKNLLTRIWAFIEGLFSKLEKKVEQYVPVATSIVEGLKKVVESGTTGAVLEVIKFTIPGDTDDKIINKAIELAKEYIPKIAKQLGIIDAITDIEDVNDQMIAVVNVLKGANDETQSDYWHELAAFILKKLADGKITLGEAGAIVEYHYQNYVKLKT
jgi:5-bromo-4-chloroindolyl phosphate hydrolysis protein